MWLSKGQQRESCSGPLWWNSMENIEDLATKKFSIPTHLHLLPVYYTPRLLLHCSNWAFFCSSFVPAAHSWGFVYFPAGFWLPS
jgi:hypothetical protein